MGLLASADQGCTWETVPPFGETTVTAMAAGHEDPNTLYIATFGAGVSGLHVSHDGGRAFETLRPLGETEYVSSLAVSPTDQNRIYAGGEDFATGAVELFLLRSPDGGVTWERIALDQRPTDARLIVRAVSYQDPDTLLISSEALDPASTLGRLLESHDAGDSFAPLFEDFDISSAGYREDGRTWATSKGGLFESEGPSSALEQTWDTSDVSCADERGAELYVCGSFRQGDRLVAGVGRRTADAAQPVDPVLLFSEAEQPVACPPATEGYELCLTPWVDWEREVLTDNAPASGAQAGGGGAAGTAPPSTMAPDMSNPPETASPVAGGGAGTAATAAGAAGAAASSGAPASIEQTATPSSGASAPPRQEGVEPQSGGCGCRVPVGTRAPAGHGPVGSSLIGAVLLLWSTARHRRRGRRRYM